MENNLPNNQPVANNSQSSDKVFETNANHTLALADDPVDGNYPIRFLDMKTGFILAFIVSLFFFVWALIVGYTLLIVCFIFVLIISIVLPAQGPYRCTLNFPRPFPI